MYTYKIKKLVYIIIFLIISMLIINSTKTCEKNDYYDTQILAANNMKKYSKAVKGYKIKNGLEIYDYDFYKTGLLGSPYNEFTTTLGNLEAKRTVTNPDIAALVVKIFNDANLKSGDKVSIALTGSFTGLNLACIAASEAMNLDITIISSMGASTYGSNQPQLTFPDIIDNLFNDGYIKENSSLVTLGGYDDVAYDIPDTIKNKVIENYKDRKLNIYINDNFNENVLKKIEVLNSNGNPSAFITIGGNFSFGDNDGSEIVLKEGILKKPKNLDPFSKNKGLINYYLNKNITTISFINIKKLMSDYGMPYDPWTWESTGKSSIYYKYSYNSFAIISVIILSTVYLIYFFKLRSCNEKIHKN
ncbi:poly-gamma-glutamate system protein [Peptoniphilus porci]|uniref:Poly-gamma-glutamate system protein n=1 Tax=Peptoniphilus porci TaxID=2652280 RepID=A0A1U7M0S4_9FIRM|nr:poly-gamma-glutamate system protein [Peptoniphilus porci]OLR65208.1 hypothetical protein BIV18_06615 [Peptoniphilus porci]